MLLFGCAKRRLQRDCQYLVRINSAMSAPRSMLLCHRGGLLLSFKGGRSTKSLPFSSFCCKLYSSRSCNEVLSNGVASRKKEINFEHLFKSCTKIYILKCLHALLAVSGKAQSIFIGTRLGNLYAHLGDVSLSQKTFCMIENKDAYTWNSMISSYVRNGHFRESLNCLNEMLSTADVKPDFYTFPPVLKACGNILDGARIHCWASKLGLEWDVFVAASLVHMYCRFQSSTFAFKIFKNMPFRDMGCWNAMISGFCQNGNAIEALSLLNEMRLEGIKMDSVTIATVLPICAQLDDIVHGMLIHLYVIKHGLELDVFVSNALINMYARFGELRHAQKVFDDMIVRDLISWNSLIAAYEQNNVPEKALKYFHEMMVNEIQPDLLTIVSLASSTAQTKNFHCCRSVHGFILRRCWIQEDVIVCNAVVDMYAKLGFIHCSRKVFDEMPVKDVVSWNSMISGYAQNGLASEAIEIYNMMKKCDDVAPNQGTWVSILPAYAHLGALREGMRTHGHVFRVALNLDVFVGTSLIDLYGKCGRLDDAMSLFYEVPRMSTVPWNAIISCHGIHGNGRVSLKLFNDMLGEGVKPDHVTFLSLLSACSHSGLVDEGKRYFHMMEQEFGIKPVLKHYGCFVDMFARAGRLETAYRFIKSMPLQPDASVWGALLGACRIHGNVELGKLASDNLFEVDPENVGYYVVLSNIYANYGKWEGVNEVRSLARDRGLKKTPGWSSVELDNKIEVFYTGNQSHPQCHEIYEELSILTVKMKTLGYTPDYTFVLQDVEDDEKEQILTSHSERLAIAYGILNTPHRSPLRIYKNLRVCGDCHNVTKLISKITEREIIVRDSNRFHHFKDGVCSCGDYW
ncbi:pentatricopeptide repeat-containing protein At4g33990-like isoform X1 [Nicotiana tomentosiformis]|uniref:pentatricopeptide repeat-containing protein At4g33990-like isoform X1 n=1 Tax=Nicotiana tomentosiformis TaxID=4098 RepID=UPI00388CEB1D